MNKEILYEILNSESEKLSSAEIEGILNEELDKSPEEMDTDLVDLCLEALDTTGEKKQNKGKPKLIIGRVLIAAVIFTLIVGISIPIGANYLNIHVPEGMVTIYKDCFRIDLTVDLQVDDVAGQLEQNGIHDVVLPAFLFSPETKISNYMTDSSEGIKNVDFDFTYQEIDGHIGIARYREDFDFAVGKYQAPRNLENIEYFNINGINTLVFNKDEDSAINYIDGNVEYDIALHCDFETACRIAKTLK